MRAGWGVLRGRRPAPGESAQDGSLPIMQGRGEGVSPAPPLPGGPHVTEESRRQSPPLDAVVFSNPVIHLVAVKCLTRGLTIRGGPGHGPGVVPGVALDASRGL